MVEILQIKSGDFRAQIILDNLPELPLFKVQKLFRLMLRDPWENSVAIQELPGKLQERINNAQENWKTASQKFADGWKLIHHPRWRTPEITAQKQINARLTKAVKLTKAQYERWVKIKSIYEGELNQ